MNGTGNGDAALSFNAVSAPAAMLSLWQILRRRLRVRPSNSTIAIRRLCMSGVPVALPSFLRRLDPLLLRRV